MFDTTKSPVVFVVVSKLVPRVSLTMVTTAPGMMPPCPSLTVPATVPVVACAAANDVNPNAITTRMTATRLACFFVRMNPLLKKTLLRCRFPLLTGQDRRIKERNDEAPVKGVLKKMLKKIGTVRKTTWRASQIEKAFYTNTSAVSK